MTPALFDTPAAVAPLQPKNRQKACRPSTSHFARGRRLRSPTGRGNGLKNRSVRVRIPPKTRSVHHLALAVSGEDKQVNTIAFVAQHTGGEGIRTVAAKHNRTLRGVSPPRPFTASSMAHTQRVRFPQEVLGTIGRNLFRIHLSPGPWFPPEARRNAIRAHNDHHGRAEGNIRAHGEDGPVGEQTGAMRGHSREPFGCNPRHRTSPELESAVS